MLGEVSAEQKLCSRSDSLTLRHRRWPCWSGLAWHSGGAPQLWDV